MIENLGDNALLALADQGYGIAIHGDVVTLLVPGVNVVIKAPRVWFDDSERYVQELGLLLLGLAVQFGFQPPG